MATGRRIKGREIFIAGPAQAQPGGVIAGTEVHGDLGHAVAADLAEVDDHPVVAGAGVHVGGQAGVAADLVHGEPQDVVAVAQVARDLSHRAAAEFPEFDDRAVVVGAAGDVGGQASVAADLVGLQAERVFAVAQVGGCLEGGLQSSAAGQDDGNQVKVGG